MAFRPPKGTFAKADRTPAEQMAAEQTADSQDKRTDSSSGELADSAPVSRPGGSTSGTRPASLQTKSRPPLDPATEILIENELKDATDDERAEWLARFKEMSPRQISAALGERRSLLASEFDRDRRHMPEAPDPLGEPDLNPTGAGRNADRLELAAGRTAAVSPSDPATAPRDRRNKPDPWDVEPLPPEPSASVESSTTVAGVQSSGEPEFDIWGDPIPPRSARPRPASPTTEAAPEVTPESAQRFADEPVADLPKPRHNAVEVPREPLPGSSPSELTVESSFSPTAPPAPAAAPRIEPMRGSRLSDWDPTKLFSRRRAADAPVASEPPSRESELPPYNPGASSNQADREGVSTPDPTADTAFASRRIDPQAPYTMDELRRLVSLMEAEAEASLPGASPELQREYLRKHINLRLLRLVADQRAEAQAPIPGLDPVDQEFWNSVFWGLSNYLDNEGLVDPTERAAATAAQFQAAARHLQSTARLELKSVAFCHRIDGFGAFERFERDEFQAGVPVLVYAEVRNFSSEPTTDGRYLTTLRSTVDIVRVGIGVGVQQAPVDRMTFEPTEDRSRSPRTDFYNSYKINLPATLPPGPYQMRLTVEDESSGKIATQTLNFSIR
jgi:hypothetical protein